MTEHFNEDEFRCHCGCGQVKVDQALADGLESIRQATGLVIRVTSGYRCPGRNKACGGATKSQHMLGTAADICTGSDRELWAVYAAALKVPRFSAGGIGIYLKRGGWIHVDVRAGRSRWAEDENKRAIDHAEAAARLKARAAA